MVTEHSLGHGTLTSIPCGAGCIVAGGIQLSHSQYLNVKDVYLCPCMIRHIWQLLGPPVMSCMVEARAQGSPGQMMKALTSARYQLRSQVPSHLLVSILEQSFQHGPFCPLILIVLFVFKLCHRKNRTSQQHKHRGRNDTIE